MLDASKKQEFVDKIRSRAKKASTNVSLKVEAEKGDYRIAMSSNEINHYFKGQPVMSIKVAELDNQEIDYINSDPQKVVQEILDEFANSFDTSGFEQKLSDSKDQIVKQAANDALSENTSQMITQKQLDDNKVKLHPRTNEHYTNITQKQLPDNGQRPGTYTSITEAQFRDERDTFYGKPRISGDWKDENRNTITEEQFNKNATEYSDAGMTERNKTSVKFDGELEKQQTMITEKQIMELLSHHDWSEPLTTTEGKEQLGKQDGELSRLTAEQAKQIVKEAFNTLGRTSLALGVTPKNLANIVSKIISHESKHVPLATFIKSQANSDISSIEHKIDKARTFGKTANTSQDWSDGLVVDAIIRQLGKISINTNANHIVNALVAISKQPNFIDRIASSTESIVNETNEPQVKIAQNIFDAILNENSIGEDEVSVQGTDSDGRYAYVGRISEVNENPNNEEKFSIAAATYAKKKILAQVGRDIELEAQIIDVNENKDQFEIQFKDVNFANTNETLEARAERRRNLVKESQFGGMGGATAPPTGGPEMPGGNAPATPGAEGQPPVESLSTEPAVEDETMAEEESGEAMPPGSFCPACKSEDVDIDNGEIRCNNCGAQGTISVHIDMKNYPKIITETKKEDDKGFGLDGTEEPEGLGSSEVSMSEDPTMGQGTGTTLPNVPVAASIRITPRMLEKLAESNIKLGSICPNCSSTETDLSKSATTKGSDGICWKCMQEYNVQIKANKNSKQVIAQYIWNPRTSKSADCNECNRVKLAFIKGLNSYGMQWNEFDSMPLLDRAKLIVKLNKDNWVNIKTASKEPLPIEKIAASSRWKEYQKFDKFPSASCIERLSRRFGENAASMSGTCQGKSLSKCVCSQLENLGIYTDGLAAKVASMQSSKDERISNPSAECVSMFVKQAHMSVNDACIACDGLRAAYASSEEMLIEAIAQINPMQSKPMAAPMPSNPNLAPKPAPMPAATGMPGAMSMPAAPAKPFDGNELGTDSMSLEITDNSNPVDNNDNTAIDHTDTVLDLDDNFVQENINDGFGGNEAGTVTLNLPNEAVEAIKVLMDALQGQIQDSMVDTTGDEFFGEDAMGNNEENGEINDFNNSSEEVINNEESSDNSMPEIDHSENIENNDVSEDKDNFESTESEESEESKSPFSSESDHEDNSESDSIPGLSEDSEEDDEIIKEGNPENTNEDESNKEKEASVFKELMSMKTGSNKSYQNALDDLFTGLITQAKLAEKNNDSIKKVKETSGKDTKLKVNPAQKTDGLGKIQDNGKMGHEEKFTEGVKDKPDVPRDSALIGDEDSEMKVNEDSALPTVPQGSAAMEGEKDYRPEKGNTADGNQGNKRASNKNAVVKTANSHCKCGGAGCQCNCGNNACGKPCGGSCGSKPCASDAKSNIKSADNLIWTVKPGQKNYNALLKKAESNQIVKLADGKEYDSILDKNKNIILTAKKKLPEALKNHMFKKKDEKKKGNSKAEEKEVKDGIEKESQTMSVKRVTHLEDDKDINQKSGPGAGKTHEDKTHSLGVDEKKPSEGMSEAEVPEAPNGGRLNREHTVEKATSGPEIPAGGGKNKEYDQNEKNTPEKQDEMLGNDSIRTNANHDAMAIKIAGQMLKTQMISIDELPNKINELKKASTAILNDYQEMLNKSYEEKGLKRTASSNSVEQGIIFKTAGDTTNLTKENTINDNLKSLFTLDKKNKNHELYVKEQDNFNIWQ